MSKELRWSKQFTKDVRRIERRRSRIKKLYDLLETLQAGEPIHKNHRPHPLKGDWVGYWECHIEPDWLLIWTEDKENIYLARTRSHADLFK